LEVLAACFFRDGGNATEEFTDFLTSYPDARRYARFRAVCDRLRAPWPRWPAALRDGRIADGDYDERAYRTHLYAQFLMHRQLAGLGAAARKSGARLYLDLPLGVHGHGYDVWAYRDLFAADMSAGAPPDPFISTGQDWGFPPIRPLELRERGHDYFIRSIRTHLRYAGALRLDHVMSLHRLFWVPHGRAPTEGVYVRYPADELYAILTLESRRHSALLIGEDLGTVPPAVRRRMDRHGLRRMWVGQFEFGTDPDHAIPTPPERAIATLNTHDMPTFLGWWRGDDIDGRQQLGWLDGGAADRDRAWRGAQRNALIERLRRDGLLTDDTPAHALLALLRRLAAGPAEIVLVNLEDLWGETRPHNIPGTWRERPNWRRRARLSLSEFGKAADVRAAVAALRR
ncbi:MAG: 4-alpha-glucanotransferase, partial [Longimicrobiales bacterium]